ncbi:MAG: hypothetical protein RLY70_1429 [Planctomycetota bacterium]
MSLLPWLFTAILCFAEPLAARSAHAIQLEPEPISEESPFALAVTGSARDSRWQVGGNVAGAGNQKNY